MTASVSDEGRDPDRGRFLATMSHDIRTPLTALRGALGLLERRDVSPEVAHQMLVMLRRASSKFERLAFGLIALDLIDNDSMPLLMEVCDLRHLVEDAVSGLRREHGAVEIEAPADPVDVICDRDRTHQALDHILDNARKFGGPGGTIRVIVTERDGHGVVSICDEGPGVADADRERIFDRYVQIGERVPNEPRGTGIGLYLARWNAETMGGVLELARADRGATFELSLPTFAARAEVAGADAPKSSALGG